MRRRDPARAQSPPSPITLETAGPRRMRPRERVMAAAPQVLARTGVVRFRLVEVAKEARVSRQTIYNHFANRDELLAELFVDEMRSSHLPMQKAVGEQPPETENLVRLLVAEVEMGRRFPLFEDLLDPAKAPRVAELVLNSPAVNAAREEAWRPILERYQDAGLVRKDLDLSETVRWITYQQFWFITHPNSLCADDDPSLSHVIGTFVLPALLADQGSRQIPRQPVPAAE